MKIVKKIGLLLLVIFVIAQFFGPEKNVGEYTSLDAFIAETNPPEDVKTIMKATCFDCHSNSTNYPWYFNVTPVNYWISDHIEEGKKELNFSKWSSYSLKRKEHKFDEIWEEVEKKKMPLDSYTWTHGDAKLSDKQIAVIVKWAKETQANYKIQINAK
jgi:hypothetical protein